MENKETITTIKGMQEKESKAGRLYKSFQTDEGNMTCFEDDVVKELQKHVGKRVKIEISENKGFKNIKKFLGEITEEKVEADKPNSFEEARKAKDICVYTSYAKDLFIACISKRTESLKEGEAKQIMTSCIELVKQAKEAF